MSQGTDFYNHKVATSLIIPCFILSFTLNVTIIHQMNIMFFYEEDSKLAIETIDWSGNYLLR